MDSYSAWPEGPKLKKCVFKVERNEKTIGVWENERGKFSYSDDGYHVPFHNEYDTRDEALAAMVGELIFQLQREKTEADKLRQLKKLLH